LSVAQSPLASKRISLGEGGSGLPWRWKLRLKTLDFRSAFTGWVAGAAPELAACVLAGLRGAQGHEDTAARAGGRLLIGRIGRIGRIRPICLIAPPFAQALGGELLAVAAAFDKGLFERGDLAVEQVVCLVDQAEARAEKSIHAGGEAGFAVVGGGHGKEKVC
jgi:hypothetical protein